MTFMKTFGLKYDPFSMIPLLSEPELRLFVDRDDELRKATTAVLLRKSLLIIGEYGVGKTSFIAALRQCILKESPQTLFFDIRIGINADDSIAFLTAIATELESYKQKGTPLSVERIIKAQNFTNALSNISINDLLTLIETSINDFQRFDKKIVFIFDDIDKMSYRLNSLAGIRDALWKMNAVFIVSSNLSQFKDLRNSAMEPFFSFIELTGFDSKQTKLLLDKRFKMASNNQHGVNFFIDDEIIQQICDISQGNPRRILRMCQDSFYQAMSRNSRRITSLDLTNFLNVVMQNSLTQSALKVIEVLSKNHNGLSVHEIYENLLKENVNITRPRVSQILSDLTRRGLVVSRVDGRSSNYSLVTVPKEKLS